MGVGYDSASEEADFDTHLELFPEESPETERGLLFLSECRELNPDYIHPKDADYRYPTLRLDNIFKHFAQTKILF